MKSKQSADSRSDRTLQEFVGGARRFRRRSQARSGSRLARLQLRLDQFAALLLLLLFAPLMAVIALLVWRRDGAPVPAAWLSTILRWSVDSSASAIRTLASFPKPVLMP